MAKRVYIPSSTVDQQQSIIVYSLAGSTTVCICEKLERNVIALGCKTAIHHPVLFVPRKTPFKHRVPGSSPGRLTEKMRRTIRVRRVRLTGIVHRLRKSHAAMASSKVSNAS